MFKPHAGWWGKAEHNLTEIVFTPIGSDATRVAALLSGEVDVVVCDGFVGNIVLKFTEGLAEGLFQTILSELQEFSPEFQEQFKPVMKKLFHKHDWQEYGGAPLLGVDGYCLICHGRSEAKAIRNAIRVGKQLVASGINRSIVDQIASSIPGNEE